MKIKNKKYIHRAVMVLTAVALIFIKAECMFQPTITQPTSAAAGSIVTITVKGNYTQKTPGTNNYRFVMGFFVPKGWNAGANTTMTYSSNEGNGVLVRVPAGQKPDGEPLNDYPTAMKKAYATRNPNLIDDHEWVVFWSDSKPYNANQSVNYVIEIKTKVGEESMLTKLGYYVGGFPDGGWASTNNENSKVTFTDCFAVTGGTGDGIDFCNKPLAATTPLRGVDNDFYTIAYDNDLFATPLSSASKVYLCVKGYTTTGAVIERCIADEKSMFIAGEQKRFKKVVWPRGFLNLTDDQVLSRMEYFIMDETGQRVGFGGLANTPFIYRFNCN
ncbi:DUF4961 domain-containing protein [Pedobacter sandarakinus]|uniref:DUF4961 domain-containing protein n=1 Tax=Pedobacter sandarakinus TaxID=353156 RepID=UPI00224504DE|nr:DUF4961 domain-containing protein [Pedobacter sandarakinus]MCX2574123.1 DUF4961 domain-containing protein [Pedobacter sandarakinus]